jgi:large subunit ribosomal protein L6
MSRIGKSPVYFDKAVQVTITPKNEVVVKGAKSTQTVQLRPEIKPKIEDGKIILECTTEGAGNFWGLNRALLQNAVTGVTKGWSKELELVGVGYRASVAGKKLEINVGFSHPVAMTIPDGLEVKVEKQTKISIVGADRQKVGQFSSVIRAVKPPEPYRGKGIKYSDEVIRRKEGKAAGK